MLLRMCNAEAHLKPLFDIGYAKYCKDVYESHPNAEVREARQAQSMICVSVGGCNLNLPHVVCVFVA